jgi:AcrR family transcriptional regulator
LTSARRERSAKSGTGPVSVERIETAAVELFGDMTYPVVGMRDISDAVGILPGSLYVHIRSKEELLLRIVERGIQNYLDAIESAAKADEPAADRLRAAIVAHMRVLSATKQQTRVAFNQWTYLSGPKKKRVIKLRRRYEELFTDILQEGIDAKQFQTRNPRIAVLAIIGTLNSATEWFSAEGELSAEEVAAVIADGVLRGLERQD